jgi:HD-like signal output (HDOD) protein/CheY-like chemotaxis protein
MLHSRQDGWQLSFVEGAPAALVAMEAEPFDVVVSDFRMPGMDGGRLLAEVRRRYPDTARVILSGHTEGKDLTAVFSLAHQFLTKPCEPEELCAAIDRALRLHQELKGEKVRAEVSGVGVLPSPASVLHDLLAVLDSPDCDDRALARELEKDVAMATKVLQLVNSSFFAPRARVTSLEAAVARLGSKTIRSMVLLDEVARGFDMHEGIARDHLEHLNRHAREAARLARRLAPPALRDDAFCAGLLHECGQLVLAACRPETFLAHLRLQEKDRRPLVDIERETFGVTHAQAGAYLLSLWGFPLEVVEAVAVHADPLPAKAPWPLDLTTIVQVAHRVTQGRHTDCGTPGGERADDTWLQRAGVLAVVAGWRAERTEGTRAA